MKILLVEDEKGLSASIKEYLSKEGYVCEAVSSYNTALEKISLYEYDIALVDITLPDGSGLDVVRSLKTQYSRTGILIISARNSLDDKITGLDLGADDYITKPFFLAEMNSRIKAVIRRRNFEGREEIEFNEIHVNPQTMEVRVNNSTADLTKKEYDLLLYFISNKSRVLTKESIAEHLWGDNIDSADSFDFIYTHIKNLRKKLLQKGGNDYIKTIYGIGYKFEAA